MENLDYRYLAELVVRVQHDNSDAFAELYAATYPRQYQYSFEYMENEQDALDTMQETYEQALREIRTIIEPNLFLPWLNQMNFKVCYARKKEQELTEQMERTGEEILIRDEINAYKDQVRVGEQEYLLSQILKLPLSEAQVIILHCFQDIPIQKVAGYLSIPRKTAKRYMKQGVARLEHLKDIAQEAGGQHKGAAL